MFLMLGYIFFQPKKFSKNNFRTNQIINMDFFILFLESEPKKKKKKFNDFSGKNSLRKLFTSTHQHRFPVFSRKEEKISLSLRVI
jgi:hypothetical protein